MVNHRPALKGAVQRDCRPLTAVVVGATRSRYVQPDGIGPLRDLDTEPRAAASYDEIEGHAIGTNIDLLNLDTPLAATPSQ
jgi:hypothetical protein